MQILDPLERSDAAACQQLSSATNVLSLRLRLTIWSFLVLAGLIETVVSRHTIQDDGICYLDMGSAILRGDWKMALNGVWSPLYPFLQDLALRIVRPSTYSQFTVVHVVNFLIYLFALACFEFFLWAVTKRLHVGSPDTLAFPDRAVIVLGYAIFLWSSLSLVTIQLVVPDILMAAFVYLAVAFLLLIWAQPQKLVWFLLLGLALGLGYLAKAPMFPLSLLFLALAWWLPRDRRRSIPRVLSAVLVFAAVAGPWIAALSHVKGKITFGESARFNYLVHVNDAGPGWYFQDLGSAKGHYLHPPHRIFDAPPVYEFASRPWGTSPIEYDPSYWSEGALPHVSLRQQVSVIHHFIGYYLDEFFASQTALFVGFLVICFLGSKDLALRQLSVRWPVWLIGLAGLAMYSFVHVELRYVGVFFALFWIGLFSGLRLPANSIGRRLAILVTVTAVIATATPTILNVAGDLDRIARDTQPNNHWRVAQDLLSMGVRPGDRVARLPAHYGLGWARLLGLTEVAEIPLESAADFWCANSDTQSLVIDKFRELRASVFVIEPPPPSRFCSAGPGWRKVGDGMYYALKLPPLEQK